jgi:hypothetical protein
MVDDLWDKPIELMIGTTDHFTSVGSSRDALTCLLNSWPTKGGKAFGKAKKACLKSIEGKVDHLTAENAFRLAAQEAGILREH